MKVLFIDRSTKIANTRELRCRPRGGTVNSLFKVTDELSKFGLCIDVFTDIGAPGTRGTVRWINELERDQYDVIVCNRGIGDGYPQISAKKRILWTHDLPHNGFILNPAKMKAFSTVFMSNYSRDQWRYFFKTIDKYTVIPNGVTLPKSKFIFPEKSKDLTKVIYFSHPNRGLEKLPLIADAVNSEMCKWLDTKIKFEAYASKRMYPNEPCMANSINEFSQEYASENNLTVYDPLKEQDLYPKIMEAGLMVMPTSIPETCSNSVLQSLACGTPVITTGKIGSVPEWVRHRKNGMLTNYLPNDYMVYSMEMVRNIVEVLKDERLHRRMIDKAANTHILTWQEVAKKWLRFMER